MAKLTVSLPARPSPAELMSPAVIKRIWAEARRESELDADVLRARRLRARRLRRQTA